ncbi:MAG: hypothetical protein WD512_13245 [Candidatus Paceibacterota bacterium]
MKLQEKKGQEGTLMTVLTGFVIVGAILFLLVLLVYTFGVTYTSLEETAITNTVTNESDNSGAIVMLNSSGYTLRGTTSTGEPRTWAISQVLGNMTEDGIFYTIPAANYTVSSTGILTNATIIPNSTQYNNISVSYTYVNNSASQTAAREAGTNTTTAIPLVGILFIILAVGALIGILIISLMGKKRS